MNTQIIYFIKSFFYRIYSSFITFLISYCITGQASIGLFIGFSDFTIKIFTYYIYEYVWEKTKQKLTKNKKNDY
jgi:uncharacterized membrane protein